MSAGVQTGTITTLAPARLDRLLCSNLRVKEVRLAPVDGDQDGTCYRTVRGVPQPRRRRPRRSCPRSAHREPVRADRGLPRVAQAQTRRTGRLPTRQARLRSCCDAPRPGCCAPPTQRRRRGPGRRLQATHRHRTRLARLQELARAAPGLPPPRRPHPRPHPIMLAGIASHPRCRNPHRRHLAQPAPPTRPHAPGHPRHRRRPRRPTLGYHQRPAWPRTTYPNRPSTSTSHPPTAHPPTDSHTCEHRACSNTTQTGSSHVCADHTEIRRSVCPLSAEVRPEPAGPSADPTVKYRL